MSRYTAPAGIVAGLAALGLIAAAEARPNYPSRVPTPYSCETCHLDPNDRLARNGFGIDFALERGLWVNEAEVGRGMCFLDSDFDGLTNGEELGDPQCFWRPGSPLPGGPTTHPGDGRDPDQCGDGVIIPLAEDCDRVLPEDETCQTQGFDEGELGCYDDCTFDTSACRDLPPDMALPEPDAAPPEPDMAPADAGPVDAMPPQDAMDAMDAMPDGSPEEGDAMPDATPDAMDAMPDAMHATGDAMAHGDAGEVTGDPVDDAGDCRATPGRAPGGGWLALLTALWWGRRRLSRRA